MKHSHWTTFFCILLSAALWLSGCAGAPEAPDSTVPSPSGESGSAASQSARDSTPVVLVPEASGQTVYQNERAAVDASHMEDGYVMVRYLGEADPVKLRIQMPDGTLYTYTLHPGDYEVFPLTGGDGDYQITVYEYRPATDDYISALSQSLSVTLKDPFTVYLYPNQYVNFTSDSRTVAKGAELAQGAADDLEVVTRVYDYITEHIAYDNDLAQTVQSGYLPDVDQVLERGKGICFDYAALMAAMLRSQGVPTRLITGYVAPDGIYHAWNQIYIRDEGWITTQQAHAIGQDMATTNYGKYLLAL